MASSINDTQDLCIENRENGTEDLSVKTQQFLDSDELTVITDPKLKREKQKLNELLESYKKLIDRLGSKFENNEVKQDHEKKLHKIPEIYAILHPELYKNPREEEKKKLINKFAKRQFYDVDKIIPSTFRTPPVNLNDARQEEKERLIKILSSCPARFLNSYDTPVSLKKVRRSESYSLPRDTFINQREAEKERLSKILATSATYYRKNLDKNKSTGRRSYLDIIAEKNTKQSCGSSIQKLRDNSAPRASTSKDTVDVGRAENMVRLGEYSPLTSKERSRTLFGYGEHEDRRNQLLAERRKEYKQYLSNVPKEAIEKVDKALSTKDDDTDEIENIQKRSRCQSISTQTEDSLDINRHEGATSHEIRSPIVNSEIQTSPQVYYLSPREKLMSDLHGVSRCFPGAASKNDKSIDNQDVRLRQAAYARALQEQIDEKKRLEEERRRKEREEDELIEQKIRMDQEKMQSEVSNEQKKKQDWMAQRQSQEEILSRKMLEMKFEAQELRKKQRTKKQSPESVREIREPPVNIPMTTSSEPSQYRNVKPQTTLSEPLRSSRDLQENKIRIPKLPENRFSLIDRAPLLDADRQNVLSSCGLSLSPNPPKERSRPMMAPVYDIESKIRDRERAEELLRAPLDFRIDKPLSPTNTNGKTNGRASSPPIPALRTRDIINNNTKVLEQKWKVPGQGKELNRTQANSDNILTQLGAFRRQLQQEHMKLEARLQNQAST
ncbi:calponin homology domain-containing protein DDB_G0272472 isoform X2 [Halyomorpha halys]|uniref:calponin homology domain-containing protein DDB_G0272472 isoform X2 n=1 Tax=Halyomorpha halys TaxID=286706 RepID=UPI0006D4D29A|nr:trichohyalin [Halyomorpha halys]